jgi:hypothetical protein
MPSNATQASEGWELGFEASQGTSSYFLFSKVLPRRLRCEPMVDVWRPNSALGWSFWRRNVFQWWSVTCNPVHILISTTKRISNYDFAIQPSGVSRPAQCTREPTMIILTTLRPSLLWWKWVPNMKNKRKYYIKLKRLQCSFFVCCRCDFSLISLQRIHCVFYTIKLAADSTGCWCILHYHLTGNSRWHTNSWTILSFLPRGEAPIIRYSIRTPRQPE